MKNLETIKMRWLMFKMDYYGMPYPIRNAYYNVRNFFFPNHPRFRKAYKRWEYKDIDCIISDTMFALLEDYYDELKDSDVCVNEDPTNEDFSYCITEEELEHAKASHQEQYEHYLWTKKTVEDIKKFREMEKRHSSDRRKQEEIDKENDAEETRILKEIIDHRGSCWT